MPDESSMIMCRGREIAQKIKDQTLDFKMDIKALEAYIKEHGVEEWYSFKNHGVFYNKIKKADQMKMFNCYFGRRSIKVDTVNKEVRVEIEVNGYWTGGQVVRRWK